MLCIYIKQPPETHPGKGSENVGESKQNHRKQTPKKWTHPDEDEDLGVPDPVLALRHPDHGELGGALALRHKVSNLQQNMIIHRILHYKT